MPNPEADHWLDPARRKPPATSGALSIAVTATAALRAAVRTLELETEGLKALRAALDRGLGEAFGAAVVLLAAAAGRVIVTGIGKSGLVGQKVAATFAS